MAASHTPGPWTVGRGHSTGRPMTVNPILRWGSIAKPATDEAWANALLIAAAPELLEALRGLFQAVEAISQFTPPEVDEAMFQAASVIAKAEGNA